MRHGIFLPESTFSTDSYEVCTPLCATACICVHIKDPVVHVSVWWILQTLKDPACTILHRLGSVTLSQLAFPKESNQNFPREKSKRDNTVVKQNKPHSKVVQLHFHTVQHTNSPFVLKNKKTKMEISFEFPSKNKVCRLVQQNSHPPTPAPTADQ